MLDPDKLLSILQRTAVLSRATPGRRGAIVHLEGATELMVAGDLHGHIQNFRAILQAAALTENPTRHLVLQELIHDPRVDPDEGIDRSHRLAGLAAALKCQYPGRVHVILGNHELSELTERPIAKNGAMLNQLYRAGIEADFGERTPDFIAAYKAFYASLPLGVRTPNRVLLCHTVPDSEQLERINRPWLDRGVFEEPDLRRGGGVYALTWGRDTQQTTADRFAELMDVDIFITGHHPCDEGFQAVNTRHLILDATDPYPCYALFNVNEPITLEGLVASVRRLNRGEVD